MPQIFTRTLQTKSFNGTISVNTGLFINGKWVDAVDGGTIEYVTIPTTRRLCL